MTLTLTRLKELLDYDPATGLFRWRVDRGNCGVKPGSVAGSKHPRGYITLCLDGKRYQAQHLAWFFVHGEWPEDKIDHHNGDKANNRILNLRPATAPQNGWNAKLATTNKSGRKGVAWRERNQCWQAYITVSGKRKHLGYHGRFCAAVKARKAAELEHHGLYARGSDHSTLTMWL